MGEGRYPWLKGCDVAMCEILMDNLAETKNAAHIAANDKVQISVHCCDVSDETQVLAFCEEVKQQHNTDHINLLFNNAGVGGAGSFLKDSREAWERVFSINWNGVYFCTRAFMPLLLAAEEGHIINTSSTNALWACLGHDTPHTAYSTAKFAIKGFSEALMVDLKVNAPHIKVSVVMPGQIGTSIYLNSGRILWGESDDVQLSEQEEEKLRRKLVESGAAVEDVADKEGIQKYLFQQGEDFRDNSPMSAAEAAVIILDAVRREQWRILVGEDAISLDIAVRKFPEQAYDDNFFDWLS